MYKDVQNVGLHYNRHLCDRGLLAVVKAQCVSIINTSVDVVQNNSEMPTDKAVPGTFIGG